MQPVRLLNSRCFARSYLFPSLYCRNTGHSAIIVASKDFVSTRIVGTVVSGSEVVVAFEVELLGSAIATSLASSDAESASYSTTFTQRSFGAAMSITGEPVTAG